MTRFEELKKKYPNLHPDVIFKLEIVTQGIRDSIDLDKVSKWMPATGSYQSYDHDVTLQDLAEKTPWRVKPGQVLRPPRAFYLNSGLGVWIMRSTRSPYQIREVSEGKMAMFEGEEQLDMDINFPETKQREKLQAVTSKGTPITDFITAFNRTCFAIYPVRSCEYFATRDECKFCNFNTTQADARTIGLSRSVTLNLDETLEAYKIYASEGRLVEGWFESGGIMSAETETNVNLRFVERIANAASYKPHLMLTAEAVGRKEYQRLKDAGLDAARIQMEVWDERLFNEIVPGKAKHLPRDKWIEAFHDAVDVFGVGNVAGKFVAGITIIPENGFSTWQEGRDSHIEGNDWCIKNGIFPGFTPLRWAPGSPISEDPANWDKFPPTEYMLDLALAHDKACKEYGMYEKVDKFLYCGLDCIRYPYAGEAGILEMAGDLGTWMSSVVPDELNWLIPFIASAKSKVKTQ